jgi:hypothetical protein
MEAFEKRDHPVALNVPWTCFISQTLYQECILFI